MLLDLSLGQWLANGLTCEVMFIFGRQECNFVSEGLLERGYELGHSEALTATYS